MKKLFRILITGVIAMGIVVSVGYIIRESSWYQKKIYPLKYEQLVKKYSKEYSLDPNLILAIIWTESKFNPEATSHKDAMGLMQITPRTGTWIANMLGLDNFKVENLNEAKLNIQMGCWYLDRLRTQFDGDMDIALAAYNGGSGNVNKWLKDIRYSKDGKTLSYIPFKETREYVVKVNDVYKKYKRLYNL